MPGNVALATPSLVFPHSLCKAYSKTQEWKMLSTFYQDGSNQRMTLAEGDRSSWQITKRLFASDMALLRSLYAQTLAGAMSMYFYDEIEFPRSFDAHGLQSLGRYTVRFAGPLVITGSISRVESQFSLVEIY